MKNFAALLFLLAFLYTTTSSFGQIKGIKPVISAETQMVGNTRALVVGISDYQNEDIPDLRFAHKDAELFAEYLKDGNGGGLDPEKITILLNEEATAGKFISALYGLLEESEEGDNVIIYFSGHGDVESTTISQPGFLLCWDSPKRIYMSGGTFGLAYFQELISSISQKTKSKVIVITDACRAGKLAGSSIGGAQATASHLAKQYNDEIKILSCQPNEYALESESWGGGRGVFSYFFLRGIQGLADNNDDGIITLSEISRYLEDNVTPSTAPHSQIPMVRGNRQTKIAYVNKDVLAKLKAEKSEVALQSISNKAVALSPEYFLDTTRFASYISFNRAIEEGHLLFPYEGSACEIFEEIETYEELSPHLGLMKRNLAAALQDETQQAINRYISGDAEEIKRRWDFDEEYWKYPLQLKKAYELLGESHFYYSALKSRYYYFKGLVRRLEAEQLRSDSLYNLALVLQDSCQLYQTDAVHSINEKGYIYYLTNQYNEAIVEYQKANAFIPSWPLVWTNLSSANNSIDKFEIAINSSKEALKLDSTFYLGYYTLGAAYYSQDSLDQALTYYLEALKYSNQHPNIYTKLGLTYKKLGQHDLSFKYLKKVYNSDSTDLRSLINLAHNSLDRESNQEAKFYFDRAKALHPDAQDSYQGLIEYHYYTEDYVNAHKELLRYVNDYPDDEMAYYLIASINAGQNDRNKALENLDVALSKGFKDLKTLNNDDNLKELLESEEGRILLQKYSLDNK